MKKNKIKIILASTLLIKNNNMCSINLENYLGYYAPLVVENEILISFLYESYDWLKCIARVIFLNSENCLF